MYPSAHFQDGHATVAVRRLGGRSRRRSRRPATRATASDGSDSARQALVDFRDRPRWPSPFVRSPRAPLCGGMSGFIWSMCFAPVARSRRPGAASGKRPQVPNRRPCADPSPGAARWPPALVVLVRDAARRQRLGNEPQQFTAWTTTSTMFTAKPAGHHDDFSARRRRRRPRVLPVRSVPGEPPSGAGRAATAAKPRPRG